MDFDEELRRQAAISALLAPPEDAPSSEDSYASSMAPVVHKPKDYQDYVDKHFDTQTDEQVVAPEEKIVYPKIAEDQPTARPVIPAPTVYPTIAEDQGAKLLTDPDTGTRFIMDPDTRQPVPHAELASAQDKIEQPPGTVMSQITTVGRVPVKRAELIDPDPDLLYRDEDVTPRAKATTYPTIAEDQGAPPINKFPTIAEDQPTPPPKQAYSAQIVTPEEASGAKSLVNPPATVVSTSAPTETPQVLDQPMSLTDIANYFNQGQPEVTGEAGLAEARSRFQQELTDNPDLARKLMASIQAEVGDQGPEAKQAYIESVMNRAIARNQTLDQTISDLAYYPNTTLSRLGRSVSPDEASYLQPIIGKVLNGSNLTNFATGNESGNVHSGGAEVRYDPRTGERFVYENQDVGWEKNLTAVGPPKEPWDDWVKVSPEEEAKISQQRVEKEGKILQDLRDAHPNMPDFMRTLNSKIPGVSDEVRQATAAEFKKQITAYAMDYYKESNPDKAYDRIMTNAADFSSIGAARDSIKNFEGEVLSKIIPNLSHAGLSLIQQATDASPLMQFLNVAKPDASPTDKANIIKQVMAQPGEDRTTFIKALYSHLAPDQASQIDLNALLNWSDQMAVPGAQEGIAAQQAAIKAAVEQNRKDLRTDPTLEHTLGGTIAETIAATPKNFLELLPVIGQSAMFSEIYSDTLDGLRQDHKDWSEDRLKATAAAASISQDLLQELINVGTVGLGSGATRGISNPIARIVTNSIMHGTVTGSASAGQQMLKNVTIGRPLWEGVLEAGEAGTIPGLAGGAVAGGHGVATDAERARVQTEAQERYATDTERYKAEEQARVQAQKDQAEARDLRQAKAQSDAQRQAEADKVFQVDLEAQRQAATQQAVRTGQAVVKQSDVLGPEDTGVQPGEEWYQPGPIITRGVERTAFSPSELRDLVGRLGERYTPEQARQILSQISPGFESGIQDVLLSPEAQNLEAERTRQIQANQPAIPPSPRPPSLRGVDLNAEVARARAMADIGAPPAPGLRVKQTPPPAPLPSISPPDIGTGKPTLHIPINSPESWISQLHNEAIGRRILSGELRPEDIVQGKGVSTENIVRQGERMSPEETNQHISNLMSQAGTDIEKQGAALRAEDARLSARSHQLSRFAEDNPTNHQAQIDAEDAYHNLVDFLNNPVRKMKHTFHVAGQALQGAESVDLSTYNGLRENWIRNSGAEDAHPTPPPAAEKVLKQSAAKVRAADQATRDALRRTGEANERKASELQQRGRKIPTPEEVQARIARRMNGDLPCRA